MDLTPKKKLIELFKKHMEIPADMSAEEIDRAICHTLEYCSWYFRSQGPKNEGEIIIADDGTYRGHFETTGLFVGQDAAMLLIEKDFIEYLLCARSYATLQISTAIQQMLSMSVPPESFRIPRKWIGIVPSSLLGLSKKACTSSENPRIFSEAKYGRFIEFTL